MKKTLYITVAVILLGAIFTFFGFFDGERSNIFEDDASLEAEPLGTPYGNLYENFPDDVRLCVSEGISADKIDEWKYENVFLTEEEWSVVRDCTLKFQ